jgi:hypothetical protein
MNCCCGSSRSPEQQQRYNDSIRTYRKELLRASLPIFVAAGIANFSEGVISHASAGENEVSIEILMSIIYACVMYLGGKVFLCYLNTIERPNEKDTISISNIYIQKLNKIIIKYDMIEFLKHVAAESAGFAWRSFAIALVLHGAFLEYGFGAGWGSFIALIITFLAIINTSNYIQTTSLHLSSSLNKDLLAFDSDAFALPLAFVFTVLLALSFQSFQAPFVTSSSSLYTWEDDYEYSEHPQSTSYTFFYCSILSLVVATLQVLLLPDEKTEHELEQLTTDVLHTEIDVNIASEQASPSDSETESPFHTVDIENEARDRKNDYSTNNNNNSNNNNSINKHQMNVSSGLSMSISPFSYCCAVFPRATQEAFVELFEVSSRSAKALVVYFIAYYQKKCCYLLLLLILTAISLVWPGSR